MAGSGQIMDLGTRYRLDQALSVAAAREDEILGGKDELDRASNFIQPAGPWVSPGPGQSAGRIVQLATPTIMCAVSAGSIRSGRAK